MEDSVAASDRLWDEQQTAARAKSKREFRDWRNRFALVVAVTALTVAAATVLARLVMPA